MVRLRRAMEVGGAAVAPHCSAAPRQLPPSAAGRGLGRMLLLLAELQLRPAVGAPRRSATPRQLLGCRPADQPAFLLSQLALSPCTAPGTAPPGQCILSCRSLSVHFTCPTESKILFSLY